MPLQRAVVNLIICIPREILISLESINQFKNYSAPFRGRRNKALLLGEIFSPL